MNRALTTTAVVAILLAVFAGSGQAEQPANEADGQYAELNGLKLWYKRSGTGPICLFPTAGWGPDAYLYIESLKPLEKTFTVVYFETRGTGHSQRPAKLTEYRYADFTADLDALRRHLGQEQVWLIGHSCGGYLVLQYAVAHPEHCLGLILLDARAAGDADQEADMKARMEAHKNEPWYAEAAKEFFKDEFSDLKDDADFQASMKGCMPFFFYDMANLRKNEDLFKKSTLSLAAARGCTASNKSQPLPPLEKIRTPTLIVVGSDDIVCSPLQAERLHLGIAGSKLIVIEKAGHFPWFEKPQRFFEAIPKGLAALGVQLPTTGGGSAK